VNSIKIAELLNVTYNTETGDVFIQMKITDPVWRQKFLSDWQKLDVQLIVKEKKP